MRKQKKIIGLRYCFNCRTPLDYRAYIQTKNCAFPNEKKKEIWKDKRFQILCCNCYNQFFDGTLLVKNPKLRQLFTRYKPKRELTLKDEIGRVDPSNYKTLDYFYQSTFLNLKRIYKTSEVF